MPTRSNHSKSELWARFRFSVVGQLLSAPPEDGELQQKLEELAKTTWTHPINNKPTNFSFSTIERWYYQAKGADDPVGKLRRRLRKDFGQNRAIPENLQQFIRAQYHEHPTWSYQLHADNLRAITDSNSQLGKAPSYTTTRRFMKKNGLLRQKRKRRSRKKTDINRTVEFENREIRSYEVTHVNSLWHLDFHEAARSILLPSGEKVKPKLLGVLDDHSRLCCHLQWYLDETADSLVHGLIQAFLKRGLPRVLLTDNGSAMTATETTEGLARLSIIHRTTLPYSPYQNAKQEAFWGPVEGRMMAMLEGIEDLTLEMLNRATQAWVEMEYHHEPHSEIGESPISRFTRKPSVGRESPSFEELRQAFTRQVSRAVRRSDGTILLDSLRLEIPNQFRHLERVQVRYAKWDYSYVYLVDPHSDIILTRIWPLDKTRNASMERRLIKPEPNTEVKTPKASGIAPLLQKYMNQYAQTGLPPAYLPKPINETNESQESKEN